MMLDTKITSIPLLTRKWAKLRNFQYDFQERTESTNKSAKKDFLQKKQGLKNEPLSFLRLNFKIYIARHQTEGRGRNEKIWKDQGKGGELLSSWVYLIHFCPQHLSSLFTGMALYESVKKIWPHLNWSLKPPNDLYLRDRKIAGLLLESVPLPSEEAVENKKEKQNKLEKKHQKYFLIIGLGFNFLSFPEDEKNATSLTLKEFSTKKYFNFLNELFLKFLKASQMTFKTSLGEKEKMILKKAITAFPHQKYLDITKKGSILTAQGEMPWKDF